MADDDAAKRRFEWDTPRWRDPDDEPTDEKERNRRFRNTNAPKQRGAVDGRSVGDAIEGDEPVPDGGKDGS
jgi:hypothetical protein